MREKFVLLDEEKVITGSYRYAWTLVFSPALALAPLVRASRCLWTGEAGSALCMLGLEHHSCLFGFWGYTCSTRVSLALCSEITPGGAGGTLWDARGRTRVGRIQGKCPA